MVEGKDSRLVFNAVPDIYDEIRPSYPAALFEVLLAMLPAAPVVVEVGPGTGQATKDLLAGGAQVHAVELGPAMAAKLRRAFPTRRLEVSVGDFEVLQLPESSADAVFAASAYHWIRPQAQADRPATLLRPGGVIAVAELIQVSSAVDDGFFEAAHRYTRGTARLTADQQLHRGTASTRRCVRCWTLTSASATSLSVSGTGIRRTRQLSTGS